MAVWISASSVPSGTHDSGFVSRFNFGAHFEHHMTIKITQDIWRVTFQLPLPGAHLESLTSAYFKNVAKLAVCLHDKNLTVNLCDRYRANLNFFHTLSTKSQSRIAVMSQHIKHSLPNKLPEKWLNKKVWSKRGFLPFVGDLGKSLFGIATEHDIKVLRHAVNTLIKNQDMDYNVIRKSTQHLASFVNTASHGLIKLTEDMRQNDVRQLLMIK